MIDLAHSHLWCWDARPWPSFDLDDAWGDAPNWEQEHWLSGRLGSAPALETIRSILLDASFVDFTVEPIPAVVDGVTIGSMSSGRAILDGLRPAYQFDAVESDGVIKFLSRLGRTPLMSVPPDRLVVDETGRTFKQTRAQETELPQVVKLRYGDPARDDQPGGTEARRSIGGSLRTLDYSLPVILGENLARGIAERELHTAWTGRERASFTLPPSFLALDPGDIVDFTATGQMMRLSDIGDGTERGVEAHRVDPLSLAPVRLPRSGRRAVPATVFRDAEMFFIDGPLLQDGDVDHAAYVGGVMEPWRSGIAVFRSPGTTGFTLDTQLPTPATMGVTTEPFYSGPTWRWDRVNTLYIRLYRGNVSSADEQAILLGANGLLIENAAGEWELLQFATATAIAEKRFALSGLLRGQKGTEHAMADPVPSGARIVLTTSALRQTQLPASLVGAPLNWRYGSADRDLGSDGYVTESRTLTAKARRPLAPVRLRGRQDTATGNWIVSWIRRTRIGGDNWETADVPLGEESERYRLRIRATSGSVPVRSIDLVAASHVYTAAEQTADFGGPASSFVAEVAQLSVTYGEGISTHAEIGA
jgi:hypothetical protein